MMNRKKQVNQRGIVLLSCLIFLILLLILMRFTIGSARISELKVGADLDQMNAQEAALLVMRDAELFVQRKSADGKSLETNVIETEEETLKKAVNFWKNDANINLNGVYNGDANPCTDEKCSNHVNWNVACGGTSGLICAGDATNNSNAQNRGKYIIERFKGDGKLGLSGRDKNTLVLRVTGIGINGNNSVGDNATTVMLQNTYILSVQ